MVNSTSSVSGLQRVEIWALKHVIISSVWQAVGNHFRPLKQPFANSACWTHLNLFVLLKLQVLACVCTSGNPRLRNMLSLLTKNDKTTNMLTAQTQLNPTNILMFSVALGYRNQSSASSLTVPPNKLIKELALKSKLLKLVS